MVPLSLQKSTNVRSLTASEPRAPGWLRLGLRVLEAAVPPLAARAGERLFLTPPRYAAPERERTALAAAVAFDVPFRGGRLRAWRWGGPGAPVLLVHGWGGRAGQMAAFAPALAEAGLPAVAFDGPAHGRSDGRISSAPDFAAAVRAVAAHQGGVRAVVAHSMGAPSTILALREGLGADAAVFLGPSLGPRGFLRQFGRVLGLSEATRAAVARRLEARFGGPFEEFDIREETGVMTIPLLVVHDRSDAEVPWEQGEAIARVWPGAELVTTEGLGHRRVLRDPAVVARVAGFLAERVGASAFTAPQVWPVRQAATPGCTSPGCDRPVSRSWDVDGRLCASCFVSADLFDRSARQGMLA